MPPSPAHRCSPGREHQMENTHSRGRSFENCLIVKAKDDDLALFNDMQNRETDNFLLHDSDDFDDSLSKLRYFSDFKLDVTIPSRGKRNDLLNADGERNDYDWLLTPPDTPLFRSLDDDEPQPQNLPSRGRPRSQPINILRSSSMTEKTHRMSRSSSSPRRLSPSPRSSTSLPQLKARPSSVPRASPPPILRSTTPSRRPSPPNRPSSPTPRSSTRPSTPPNRPSSPTPRSSTRPSTPPNRPSSPTPRSSTPTLRRMSTGSTGQASSSGRRAASPIKSSRGNSASPKLRGWQTDLPGFSSDAPPNLRTSISDRSVTHVRGMSPTSRSGRGRQSMSPTGSRSATSSHSHERDIISCFSKGSVVSSCDDDVDSLHSTTISSSPPTRRNGAAGNNRPMAFSKKPSRTSSSSSIPKRSFDSVLHQMEHRKTPQNMFRPLLSSVPATTFYVGKANSMHRPVFSRNSSLTTSTSAISEQGASVAPDMEGNEHDRNDVIVEWERTEDPDTHEDLFIFDKPDVVEDYGRDNFAGLLQSGSSSCNGSTPSKLSSQECGSSMVNFGETASTTTSGEPTRTSGYYSVVDGFGIMGVCSKCGKRFQIVGLNGNTDVCEECVKIDELFAIEPSSPITVTQNESLKSDLDNGDDKLCNEVQPVSGVPESHEKSSGEVVLCQPEWDIQRGSNCLDHNCPTQLVTDQCELHLSDHQLDNQPEMGATQSDSGSKIEQMEHTANPSHRVENSEGSGISVLLLQRSSSSKWPVVQGRVFSATNILCSEPSYVRDNTGAMRRSIGRDSASASSSMDLGSSRPAEVHVQKQFSSRKSDVDRMRSDSDAKDQCSGSHPDLIVRAYEPSIHHNSEIEDKFNNFSKITEDGALRESVLVTEELSDSFDHADTNALNFLSTGPDPVDDSAYVKSTNSSDSQLVDHPENVHYDSLSADILKNEAVFSCIGADQDPAKGRSTQDTEVPYDVRESFVVEEKCMLSGPACQNDVSDTATTSHSVVILESQEEGDNFQDSETEDSPSKTLNSVEFSHEQNVSTTSEKEESTVIVEGPRGQTSRSLTLAEATDSILFCSSIVHDIVYKAAKIGMEKEFMVTSETSRPTVMLLGKSVIDEKDLRRMPNKRTPKSQKTRRKKFEIQTKSPPEESEHNVVAQGPVLSSADIPNKAVDSTKPPKLESKCNCAVM